MGKYRVIDLNLRPATLADVELLGHWDQQPHVRASDPNDDWAWEVELDKAPDWREQLIAELDGRPIGFIQIIDPAREESHYWGDVPSGLRAIDIWIGEERGFRERLWDTDDATGAGTLFCRCDCNGCADRSACCQHSCPSLL